MPQGIFRIWADPNQVRVLYEENGVAIIPEETYVNLHIKPVLEQLPWREEQEDEEARQPDDVKGQFQTKLIG